jgi:hypothetical protein
MKTKNIKYIPFVLFIVVTLIIFFLDFSNIVPMIVFTLATAIPIILPKIFKLSFLKSETKDRLIEGFYFGVFFFYFGYAFNFFHNSNSSTPPKELFTNGTFIFIIGSVYILMCFGLLVFLLNKERKDNDIIVNNIISNSILPIKSFIELTKYKEANILAVAGNLQGLKTKKGVEFLKQFLSQNVTNKLELFIPIASKEDINSIKRSLNNADLTKRVTINVVEPFVFLQGIVYAGKEVPTQNGTGLVSKGYYIYKPIENPQEIIDTNGIFVDLSDKDDVYDEHCIAINSFYSHLNNKSMKINNKFEYDSGLYEIGKDSEPYNHIVESKTLNYY